MILKQGCLSDTPPALRAAEEEVLTLLDATMMAWCGRAATGLFWAYRLARRSGDPVGFPEVILPAISCASPANAALLAGCRPRFADVDPQTGMMTLEAAQQRWTASTRAVVFIHLYGQTADLGALADWCRGKGIVLIEDLAQAQGARLPSGGAAGSQGDLAVFSFNRTKILDCGGGALVARSERLADLAKSVAGDLLAAPEIDASSAAQLELSQRNLYHALVVLRRMRAAPEVAGAYLPFQDAYSGLFVRSLHDAAPLADAWPTLPALLQERARKAAVYGSKLDGGPWRLLDGWRSSGVCWRYSLLVDSAEQTQAFTEAVRRDGFYVSNLYWPLNDFFNPQDACPHAEAFARRVVNLWVDHTVSLEWVDACARSLCAHATSLEERRD